MAVSRGDVRLLTIPEFIALCRISRSTFYSMQRRGELPPLVRMGARVFIGADVAEDWLRLRQGGASKPSLRGPRVIGDKQAVTQTGLILRTIAAPNNLTIVLALCDGLERPIAEVAALTGMPETLIRQSVPGLRGLVSQRRNDGDTVLKINDPATRDLCEAIYRFHASFL